MVRDGSVTEAPTVLVEAPQDTPFASQIHGSWAEVRSTLSINTLMGLSLLLFFELRRGRRSIFGPRLRRYDSSDKLRTLFRYGMRIPFGWLPPLVRLHDEELAEIVGLDAYFVLRFAMLWRRLFLFASIAALFILIPFYRHSGHHKHDFFRLTIANAQGNEKALWACFLFTYAWTLLVLTSLENEARHYLQKRKDFLASTIDQTRCSVLLERVPPNIDAQTLAFYLGNLLGDPSAVAMVVIYDRDLTATLSNAVSARHYAAYRLQRALISKTPESSICTLLTGTPTSREHRRAALVADLASRLDALDAVCMALAANADQHTTYTWQNNAQPASLQAMSAPPEIMEASTGLTSVALAREAVKDSCCCWGLKAPEHQKHNTSDQLRTAVATMRSPGLTGDASQLTLSSEPLGLTAQLAPSPYDILWKNSATHVEAVGLRRAVSDVALLCSALALTPIVSGFQLVSNLDEISRFVPSLRPLFEEHPWLAGLVTGYVPVVLLLCLFMIVPLALEQLAKRYIRFKSRSAVQAYMLPRYFAFQMLAIYVTVLAGSLASTLQELVAQGPNAIITLLGRAVPSAGPYFLQYLIVKLCFSLPLELARPVPYLMADMLRKSRKLYRKLSSRPRDESLDDLERTSYGTTPASNLKTKPTDLKIGYYVVPELLMVVALGSLCAATAPLVAVLAWLYFAFAEAVYTRQFLFVYENTHDSGAKDVWPALHRSAVYALFVAHFATLSTLYLLGGRMQAILMAPLPIIVHAFYAYFLKPYYIDPAASLDRHTARALDLFKPIDPGRFDTNFYRQPSLTEANLALNSITVAHALSADSTTPCQAQPRIRQKLHLFGDDDDDDSSFEFPLSPTATRADDDDDDDADDDVADKNVSHDQESKREQESADFFSSSPPRPGRNEEDEERRLLIGDEGLEMLSVV